MGQLRHLPAVCSCFRCLSITGVNRSLELQTDKQICSVMWEQQLGLCCRLPQGSRHGLRDRCCGYQGCWRGSIAAAPCAEPQDRFLSPDPARQVAAPNPVRAWGRGSNPSSRGDTSDLFVHSRHRPSSFPAPAAAQMLLYNGRLLGRVIYLLCYVSAEADAGVTPSEQPPPRGERGLSSPKLHRGRWVQLLRALLALCCAWRQKQSVSNRWGPGLQSLRAPQGSDRCRDVKGQAGAAGMLCFRGHFLSRKTATSIIQGSRHENAFSSSSDSPKRCA